jgi:Tfp pilus assembly protein PilE
MANECEKNGFLFLMITVATVSAIALVATISFAFGVSVTRQEAVKAKVGEWKVTDERGSVGFRWIEQK